MTSINVGDKVNILEGAYSAPGFAWDTWEALQRSFEIHGVDKNTIFTVSQGVDSEGDVRLISDENTYSCYVQERFVVPVRVAYQPVYFEGDMVHIIEDFSQEFASYKKGQTYKVMTIAHRGDRSVYILQEVVEDGGAIYVWEASAQLFDAQEYVEYIDLDADHQKGIEEMVGGAEVRSVSSTGAEKGVKLAQYSLLPADALREVAEHYGKGAEKYAKHNMRKGYEWSKSFDALMRHAQQFWGGEDFDSETGSKHLSAVVFHALTLMEFMEDHREFDDRYVV